MIGQIHRFYLSMIDPTPVHRCEPVTKIDANQSQKSLRTPLRRNGVHQPWLGDYSWAGDNSWAGSLVLRIQSWIFLKLHDEPEWIFTQFEVYNILQNTEIRIFTVTSKMLPGNLVNQKRSIISQRNKNSKHRFDKFRLVDTKLNKFTACGDQLVSNFFSNFRSFAEINDLTEVLW